MISGSPSASLRAALTALASLALWSCGPADGADISRVPEAKAGCEEPSEALGRASPGMLPGRDCGVCHRTSGQATNSPFTISGTVFGALDPKDGSGQPACNAGGLSGWVIEVRDSATPTPTVRTYTTNGTGNFYSTDKFVGLLTVRMWDQKEPDKKYRMQRQVGVDPNDPTRSVRVNCNGCHQIPGQEAAPGRIFPDPTALE